MFRSLGVMGRLALHLMTVLRCLPLALCNIYVFIFLSDFAFRIFMLNN